MKMHCPGCAGELRFTGIFSGGNIYICSQCHAKWIIEQVKEPDYYEKD